LATYLKHGFVILVGAGLLAACSSQPSPWSQSSSPWGNKNSQADEVVVDDTSTFVEPMPTSDAAVEPIEPVDVGVGEPIVAEPVVPEVVMAEPEADAAPVTNNVAVGGDLRSLPGSNFAVQVCASRSMKQLAGFAKRHQLSDQWMAQTSVKGETWFVLLEGVYATRAEARQALERVSGQVDTKPWIRSVGSLQAVMQ
jgi:DamX protein